MSAVDVIIFWGDGCSASSEKTENFKLGHCYEFCIPSKSFYREGEETSDQKFKTVLKLIKSYLFQWLYNFYCETGHDVW